MDLTQKLTPNWSLAELIRTEHREFLSQQQNPSDKVLANLKMLAEDILQPLHDLNNGDPLHANNGYRCKGLNEAVGGAHNSQHECGEENGEQEAAADLIDYKNGNLHLFELIRNSNLPFDQLITECPDAHGVPAWVHVSVNHKRNRREVLKAKITGHHENGSPIFTYEKI